jgi:cell division septal protein FtsQ
MTKRLGANKLKKRRESWSTAALVRKGRAYFSIVKIALLASVICGGAVFGAMRLWTWVEGSPRFAVKSIQIRGTMRTNPEEIRRLSRIEEGMRMLDIKPKRIEKAIMANRWVKRVHVSRSLPQSVIVVVEERSPIALVNIGRVCYIDEEGVELPLFPSTYSDLPLVSGIGPDSLGTKIRRTALQRIVSLMSKANSVDSSLMRHVSQIDFINENTARIKLENTPMLVEIDDQKGDIQWKRFEELIDVFSKAPEGMPKAVNLCYSNLAFAQW